MELLITKNTWENSLWEQKGFVARVAFVAFAGYVAQKDKVLKSLFLGTTSHTAQKKLLTA